MRRICACASTRPRRAGRCVEPRWEARFVISLSPTPRAISISPCTDRSRQSASRYRRDLLAALRLARIAGTLPSVVGRRAFRRGGSVCRARGLSCDRCGAKSQRFPPSMILARSRRSSLPKRACRLRAQPTRSSSRFGRSPKGLWGEADETEPHYALDDRRTRPGQSAAGAPPFRVLHGRSLGLAQM